VDRLEADLEGEAEVLRINLLSSLGRQLGARYGVRGVPTLLVFDGSGEVVYTTAGRLDGEEIEAAVRDVLDDSAAGSEEL